MGPAVLCTPRRVYFKVLLTGLAAYACILTGLAHPVVSSEYSLHYKNEQWVLTFEQKTSYLRDAVYASKPDLKGINLNSNVFLEATEAYITANINLTYKGKPIRIVPRHMQYGGLRFKSAFFVEGLPEKPGYLTIKSDGFDVHEHAIVLFRVITETEGYLNYFNKDQRLATFDFDAHQYVFEEIKPGLEYKMIFYFVSIVFVIGGVAMLFQSKKTVKTAV